MQRAFFIWALILPCFAKVIHKSDLLTLEALNEELEYVTNRLDRFIANQGDWDEGGLDLPTKDVTWSSLMTDLENLINKTVELHIHKLDLKCLELNNIYQNEVKRIEQDYSQTLPSQHIEDEEQRSKVRDCADELDLWKINLTEAQKSVKYVGDLVKNFEVTLIEIKNNILQQENSTTKIELDLQKLISDSDSISNGQADINAAILKIEEKQEKLMEEMGYEMMRQMKQGNDDMKQENNFIKSFLEEIMVKIVELKDFKGNLTRKAEELLEKLNNIKTEDEAAMGEYGSTQEAIEQLRKQVSQQTEEISRLKESSASDDELRQVRDAIDAIRASPSSRSDVATVEAKIAEVRRTCVTGDDVRRLLQTSQDSKCSARVKHTPGRPSRLQIEIISSGKRKS